MLCLLLTLHTCTGWTSRRASRGSPRPALTSRHPLSPQDERFSLNGKIHGQYCNLYYNRLLAVKARLKTEAENQWPGVPGARAR